MYTVVRLYITNLKSNVVKPGNMKVAMFDTFQFQTFVLFADIWIFEYIRQPICAIFLDFCKSGSLR